MKIGRNDPCPCGSGLKYKKCCLRKGITQEHLKWDCIKDAENNFEYITPNAREINSIIRKYSLPDVVKAIFCINLWRKNRSALGQGLSLNMALVLGGQFGELPIEDYDSFTEFYNEIAQFTRITWREDFIIDDYGEIFINHSGISYPIITGTGHQQVYGALRFMHSLSEISHRAAETSLVLQYIRTIIEFTQSTNAPNTDGVITHELPSEEFWNSIKSMFDSSLFQSQVLKVYGIMGYQFGPVERRHFIVEGNKVFPLCNLSIAVDYYDCLLNTVSESDQGNHIRNTIHSLIENSFNFAPNTPNRILLDPRVLDTRNNRIINEGLLFAGMRHKDLLIAIDSNSNVDAIVNTINQLNQQSGFRLAEPYYRPDFHGACGADVMPECPITYMAIDPFTNISSQKALLEGHEKVFNCTALDALYMLGFANDIDEIIDFIHYEKSENAQIFTFGGKNNHFFDWKMSNQFISSGAIEYDHISLDFNTTENYVKSYFSESLCDFPRNECGLFSDPLNWTVEEGMLNCKRFHHKGCLGFGGEIIRLNQEVSVFLAHNVEFFTKEELEANAGTILNLIDELNVRLFMRYASLVANLIPKGKVLQVLYLPWFYAQKNYADIFLNDRTRKLVYSDEYVDDRGVIIRYSVDPAVMLDAIGHAPDRREENRYFKELLRPLEKYSPDNYQALVNVLTYDSDLKKTVDVFKIEQHYYYSNLAYDTEIAATSFAKARKEIAKACFSAGVHPGEYHGQDATTAIRKMQTAVVEVFEQELSKYDKRDLFNRVLGYYAVQQNGVIINAKRYFSFADLDEEVQHEFEQNTRNKREELRRNVETAKYLLESNLVVSHSTDHEKCGKEEFSYLLAFADWLVVLQDDADTCHYTDFDLSISVDSEYKIDTVMSAASSRRTEDMLLRKYNTTDYHVKNDSGDIEFYKKAMDAFEKDTGIKLSLLFSLMEYMQLDATEDGIGEEVFPNVFEADPIQLLEKFNSLLEEPVRDLDDLKKTMNFITLNPTMLKTINGRTHDILPIWEREKRDERFDVKPIVMFSGKCVFSPVALANVLHFWKNGIPDWYLPYEIGCNQLMKVLKQWKKRYEDEMVQDIAQLFRKANFDFAEPEVDLVFRFPKDQYPAELGDYDVLAISTSAHEIWIIESKVIQKVGSIYEDQMQQKSFFYQHKDDEKFQRRIDYMLENYHKVLSSFSIDYADYKIIPYMVTNKIFYSKYKQISFPIICYDELRKILEVRGDA